MIFLILALINGQGDWFSIRQGGLQVFEKWLCCNYLIINTANPSVSMNIQNASSQSSNWEESSFSKSQCSNSTAMGFGGWIFGHSGGKSVEGEDISNFDSTSVSSSDEFGEFTITSSGLGGINGDEVNGPNPYYGYAGLEIGYRVKVIADPNPFIVVKDDAQPLARRSQGPVLLRKALFKDRKIL